MKVVYRNGKIYTPQLELNAVEHCNLRCVECSHLSPYVSPKVIARDSLERDLAVLAPVLHCGAFRFVGGEPLLHKGLPELIRMVRDSGVSDRIVVVSNGTLIDRMPDEFFQSIDALEISWYPQTAVDTEKIAFAASRCEKFGCRLSVNEKPGFRKVQIDRAIENRDVVQLIYDSCRNAHVSVCHAIHNGYYYKCSRPIFTDRYVGLDNGAASGFMSDDGINLHDPELLGRLTRYIESKEPLRSCTHCLGTAGKAVKHRQMTREEILSTRNDSRTAEDLVDWKVLRFDRALSRVLHTVDLLAPHPSLRHALIQMSGRFRPRRARLK